jgi:hypothetical protein
VPKAAELEIFEQLGGLLPVVDALGHTGPLWWTKLYEDDWVSLSHTGRYWRCGRSQDVGWHRSSA